MANNNTIRRFIKLKHISDFEGIYFQLKDFQTNHENLVELTKNDVVNAIQLKLDGKLSFNQLRRWSEFIEMCDQINFEVSHNQKIADIIFELANPEINDSLRVHISDKVTPPFRFKMTP